MANFVFNSASAALQANTLDLSTGSYYAHIVTATPILSNSTVNNLVLPSTSGYAATVLTGLSYTSTRWTFANFAFPKYLFASAPVGVVICKRSGATPVTTDVVICYSAFFNSIGQPITLTTENYLINLQFGVSGAINFLYRYQYSSGAFATGEPTPKGSLFMMGSKNNTTSFVNPFTPSQISCVNANNATTVTTLTDRAVSPQAAFTRAAFNFGSRSIRIGIFGFFTANTGDTVQVYGAGSNLTFDSVNVADNTKWTLLGSMTVTTSGWNFITTTDQTYWQYAKIETTSLSITLQLRQIEFYSSNVLSPTVDFI